MPAPRLPPTADHTVDRATLQGRLERFRQRWEARDGLEKQQAQEFLRELLSCYGRSTQTHEVLFEYPLTVDGRQRWADLLLPEELLVEMKSARETDRLAEHYPQAEAYWRASGAGETRSPRFVVLCSFRLTTLSNRLDDGAHRDLVKLHDALDQAVLRAYGWPLRLAGRTDEAEDELLVRLHEANRTIADGARAGYEAFALTAPPEKESTELLF